MAAGLKPRPSRSHKGTRISATKHKLECAAATHLRLNIEKNRRSFCAGYGRAFAQATVLGVEGYFIASTSRRPERVRKVLTLPVGMSRSISRLVSAG